jgi:hypothetical protein
MQPSRSGPGSVKQPGESARLYYDGRQVAEEGDYIRTPSGRTYLVEHVRIQEKGKHAGRQHLQTVVMSPDHVPEPDARVLPIYWYRR